MHHLQFALQCRSTFAESIVALLFANVSKEIRRVVSESRIVYEPSCENLGSNLLTEYRSGDGGAAGRGMGLGDRRGLLHVQPLRRRDHLQLRSVPERHLGRFRGVQG